MTSEKSHSPTNKISAHSNMKKQEREEIAVENLTQKDDSSLYLQVEAKISALPESIKEWLETKSPPPWECLTTDQNSTVLVYVHIPKITLKLQSAGCFPNSASKVDITKGSTSGSRYHKQIQTGSESQ